MQYLLTWADNGIGSLSLPHHLCHWWKSYHFTFYLGNSLAGYKIISAIFIPLKSLWMLLCTLLTLKEPTENSSDNSVLSSILATCLGQWNPAVMFLYLSFLIASLSFMANNLNYIYVYIIAPIKCNSYILYINIYQNLCAYIHVYKYKDI